jgi:hypothetical protein
MTDDFFNHSRDRRERGQLHGLVRSDITQQTSIMQLRAEVQALRACVLTLLASAAQGVRPDISAEPIRSFLGAGTHEDPQQALNRLLVQSAPVIGKVNCPRCGAVVEDKLGVYDEVCIFCGDRIRTAK